MDTPPARWLALSGSRAGCVWPQAPQGDMNASGSPNALAIKAESLHGRRATNGD